MPHQNGSSNAAVIAILRKKLIPTPSCEALKTTNYSRKFGFMNQDISYSTQMTKRRHENLEWEGVIGHWVTDIC